MSSDDVTAEKPAVEEKPPVEQPVAEVKPAAETPVTANQPAAEKLTVEEKPAADKPVVAEKLAAEEKPAAEKPVAAEKPDAEKPAAQKPAAKKPAAKKPAAKKPAAKKQPSVLAGLKGIHKTSVSDEIVIRFDHVTKTYHLYKNDRGRLLSMFSMRKNRYFLGSVNANDDLSFEIKKGEAVAFIGQNGAGKSTALKMITGVTHPTSGTIEVNGRVSALLELSAGFDGNLTGRENIALRGQILGLTKEEMAVIEPKAIDFADLGVYIDQPLRTYSSGMKARLGFSLAVSIDPEILVVDEALSVGDRSFKNKCVERIREIMTQEEVTVLFVTHATATAKEICSRGIVLDKGKKRFEGNIDEAIAFYEENF